MNFFKSFPFLCIISLALSHQHVDIEPYTLPRPLIIELNSIEEVGLRCVSWRVAVEANNLKPWKMIPEDCVEYVKEYMLGRLYEIDVETVSNEAVEFAMSIELNEDGMDAWVFDIDETLLSNLPYYAQHGYGYDFFHL